MENSKIRLERGNHLFVHISPFTVSYLSYNNDKFPYQKSYCSKRSANMFSEKSNSHKDWLINLLALIVIIVAFLVISSQSGLLYSGFRYFIDDHQIPLVVQDLDQHGLLATISKWLDYENNQVARFRPYYQIQIVLLAKLFGLNSFAWFTYISILGGLTTFFLFLFARLLSFSLPIAIIFSLTIVLGTQSETWVRPMIPDSQGMFFLALVMVLLAFSSKNRETSRGKNIKNILALFCVLVMSLCKESYILIIPTLFFLRIYLLSHFEDINYCQSLKLNLGWLIGVMTIFVGEIVYIIFFLGKTGNGYAGVDKSSFSLSLFSKTAWDLAVASYTAITLLAICLLLVITCIRKKSLVSAIKPITPFIILLLTALVPHTLLYAKSGISAGFYLFPFIVFACLLLCKVLSELEKASSFLSIVVIGLVLVLLFGKAPVVWGIYSQQAQDNYQINALLQQSEACTQPEEAILVVANPRMRYEALDSLQRVLRSLSKRQNLVLATYGLEGTDFYSSKFEREEKYWEFLDPHATLKMYNNRSIRSFSDKSNIQAIIIFDGLDTEFKQSNQNWFNPDFFENKNFQI